MEISKKNWYRSSLKELLKIVIVKTTIINKYFLRFLLFFLFKLIKDNMSTRLKIKLRYKLLSYPRTKKILKPIYLWLKSINQVNKILFLNYFLGLFIRFISLPLLRATLNKEAWRAITLKQLKNLLPSQKNLEIFPMKKPYTTYLEYLLHVSSMEKTPKLSYTAQQVYKDLKIHLDVYHS